MGNHRFFAHLHWGLMDLIVFRLLLWVLGGNGCVMAKTNHFIALLPILWLLEFFYLCSMMFPESEHQSELFSAFWPVKSLCLFELLWPRLRTLQIYWYEHEYFKGSLTLWLFIKTTIVCSYLLPQPWASDQDYSPKNELPYGTCLKSKLEI